jgi:DNA-binding CsgD family transcriptional regulator
MGAQATPGHSAVPAFASSPTVGTAVRFEEPSLESPVMAGDPRLLPITQITRDRVPRAWITAARPLHAALIEAVRTTAPANLVIQGRRVEVGVAYSALERALDGGRDLDERLSSNPAWLVVAEPQWVDRESLAAVSRAGDSDTPIIVISSEHDARLADLRDALASDHRHFAEPWIDDGDVEDWVGSIVGRPLFDGTITDLLAASGGSSHLLTLLVSEAARRELRMAGAADAIPGTPAATVVEFVTGRLGDQDPDDGREIRLAAVTSTPVPAAVRPGAFASGLVDVGGVVFPAVADAIVATLSEVDRRDLADRVAEATSKGALAIEEAARAFLLLGRVGAGAVEPSLEGVRRWAPTMPERALALLDLLPESSETLELEMRALALTGQMTRAAMIADRILALGPSPQASLVTAAGLAAAARFKVAAGSYAASDPDDQLRIGAQLLAAPVLAAIAERPALGPSTATSLTSAAVATFAGAAMALVEGGERALAELRDGAEMAAVSDATLWPDTPHTLAALALTLDFDHDTAARLLGHGLDNQVGGAAHRSRHRLLTGWVAVRSGRWADAEAVVADTADTPLGLRDRLSLVGLHVALARRAGALRELEALLDPAIDLIHRHPIDLVSLPAHGEIAIAVARMGATERAAGLLDQLGDFSSRMPERPWRVHTGWVTVVAGLLAARDDWVTSGAAVLSGPLDPVRGVIADLSESSLEAVTGAVLALESLGQVHEASLVAAAAALDRTGDDGRPLVGLASRLRGLLPGRGGQAASGLEALSDREVEVARELIDGRRYKEIGERLFISAKTVEHHIAHIKTKLGATNRSDMITTLRQALG